VIRVATKYLSNNLLLTVEELNPESVANNVRGNLSGPWPWRGGHRCSMGLGEA